MADEERFPDWLKYFGFIYVIVLLAALIMIPPVAYADSEALPWLALIYVPIIIFAFYAIDRPHAPRLMKWLFVILACIAIVLGTIFSALFIG